MNSELTVNVPGQRLQVTCRALGISFKQDGEWYKTSRNYPPKWRVSGVIVSEADAVILNANLAEKKAKQDAKVAKARTDGSWRARAEKQAKEEVTAKLGECPSFNSNGGNTESGRQAWRQAFYDATERFILLDAGYAAEKSKEQKRREANTRREERELGAVLASVNARWTVDAADVKEFSKHANETGKGRVVRTKTACKEDFDTKVYMALVAWVRHNKTDYDAQRRNANDAAYSDYLQSKEWGDDYETRGELLEQARAESSAARNTLHEQFTAEAVAWLEAREKSPEKTAILPLSKHDSHERKI